MATISEILADIDALLPTNNAGAITASILRNVLKEIVNNEQITASQILTTSGTADTTTFLAGDNTWKVPPGTGGGGGGAVVPAGAVPETTRTIMQTLTFTTPPDSLRTNGYNEVGIGPAFYTKAPGNTVPAHWPSSGVLTTGDGTNYLITPEKSELWVEQFGAKGRDNADRTDQWQAFEDCKYVILLQADVQGWNPASSEGGTIMRIGRGSFYMTKSHSIEGGSYDVKGSGDHNGGTMIRTPFNVDGFQVQYNFGGQGQTFGHEGGPLNAGARLLGSLGYVPGQTHIYLSTNTGAPNPAAWPSGTGPGTITSGSATFTYVRERTWSETRGIGGDYAKISNLVCVGIWNPSIDGFDEDQTAVDGAYHCGILMRARATAENISCQSYAGHGLCIAGDGGSECRGGGVPNNAIVRNYRGYFNGHDGLRFDGTDANAGLAEAIDTALNKRSGITDESMFGNRYVQVQSAFDGSPGNVGTVRYGACTYGGYYYSAMPKQLGSFRTVNYALTPGAAGSEFSWVRTSGTGSSTSNSNWPDWSAGLFFQAAGGFISQNINAENQILGLYIEGGGYSPQLGLYDMAWGGNLGNPFIPISGGNMYSRATWQNRMMTANYWDFDGSITGTAPDNLKELRVIMGGQARNPGKSTEAPDATIWGYNDWTGNQVRCQLVSPFGARDWRNTDTVIQDQASPNFIFGWTSNNTTYTFGQSVTQRGMPYFPRFVLGSGSSSMADSGARVWQMTTGNLGTGTTAATGDANGKMYIYANPSAGAGDPWGWQVRNGFFWPLYP